MVGLELQQTGRGAPQKAARLLLFARTMVAAISLGAQKID